MKKLIPLLIVLLSSVSFAAAERRCVTSATAAKVLLSSNIDGFQSLVQINKVLQPAGANPETPTILVRDKNDGVDVQFMNYQLTVGDCVLGNPIEQRSLYVAGDTRLRQDTTESLFDALVRFAIEFKNIFQSRQLQILQPVVLFRKSDDAKLFGYVLATEYAALTTSESKELTPEGLLDYTPAHQDLTLLYLLCPKTRDEVCTLSFKHKGKWVEKNGRRLEFKVLARSQRNENPTTSYRITSGGDTPQGIYYLWASMYTESLSFGGVPRVDLDASQLPVNAMPYNLNSLVLDQIVPQSALNDYWLNEYPLAFKLGRNNLRLHDDTLDPQRPPTYTTPETKLSFRPTAGCINAGHQITQILAVLTELGVFKAEDLQKGNQDPATLGWNVSGLL
jgi:hypothetical protein